MTTEHPDATALADEAADCARRTDLPALRRRLTEISETLPGALAEHVDLASARDVLVWSNLVLHQYGRSLVSTVWCLDQEQRQPAFWSRDWIDALPAFTILAAHRAAASAPLLANVDHHHSRIRHLIHENLAVIVRRVPGSSEWHRRVANNLRSRHLGANETVWMLLASRGPAEERREWLAGLVRDHPWEDELAAVHAGAAVPNRLGGSVRASLINAMRTWSAAVPVGAQEALFEPRAQLALDGMAELATRRAHETLRAAILDNPFLDATITLERLLRG